MTPFITIEKVWFDVHAVEFAITVSDGCSQFRIKAYTGHEELASVVAGLDDFKLGVFGGIYDVEFGAFGPEYAGGAFRARLHFDNEGRGQLSITVHAESDWYAFNRTHVASRATLYLKSECPLLDEFIEELRQVSLGTLNKATLGCVAFTIEPGALDPAP